MRLARVDHQLARHAVILQSAEELVALTDRYDDIFRTVDDQRGRFHALDVVDGREAIVAAAPLVWAGAVGDLVPCAYLGHAVERAPVADAGAHHGRLEAIGLRDRPGSHKAAVAPAADAQPLRVGDAQP